MTKRNRQNYDDAGLAGANLAGADLAHTSMRRAHLKGANLAGAALAGADLHGAQMDDADVTGADLRGADLTGASLHGVDLDRAATTEGARLAGARGVAGQRPGAQDVDAISAHLVEAADDTVLLTRDIAELARATLAEAGPSGSDAGRATRDAALARIAELQERRGQVEERLLSLLDEGTGHRPAWLGTEPA